MAVKVFPFLKEDEHYYFDALAAQKVIDFIERFCKLSDPMGQAFKLLAWQRQIVLDVFGWKRRDNNERRFNYVYIEVPRKNGKTYFVAALLLYLLMADNVMGGEVYASACSREQSGILFKSVLRMVNQSKFLTERLTITPYRSEIKYRRGDSVLKALSGESVGSHGKYPSACVFDELHEWIGRKAEDLYEALTSGWGNRKSPLAIHITTAGFGSQPTLAKRMHEKAIKFAEGTLEDATFYGVVYGLDQEADWTSEAKWKEANPSYDLVVKTLKREFAAAKSEPSKENTFKRLYLNIWTQQQTRWLDMVKYDDCCKPIKYEDYKGGEIVLGVDFASIYDLTSVGIWYPQEDGSWVLFSRSYMPQKSIDRYSKEDNVPYDQWQKQGWLTSTVGVSKGQTTDYATLLEEIKAIAANNRIVCVGYDPSQQAALIIPQLEDMGLQCLPIYQYHKEMSPASREFERRLTSGEITIEDNPLLRWQAGNVEVEWKGELIKPTKPNGNRGTYSQTAKYKVDGIVAAIIGVQAMLLTYGRPDKKEANKPKAAVYYV